MNTQLQNMMWLHVICRGTLWKYPLKNRKITKQSCCHKIHLNYKSLIEVLSTTKKHALRVRHVSARSKYIITLIARVLFPKHSFRHFFIPCTWEKSNIAATLNSGTLKLRVKHSLTYFFWILMWSINITAPCDDNWELESIKHTRDYIRKHIPVKICTFLLTNKQTNTFTVLAQKCASPYKRYWIKLSVFLSKRQRPPAFSACQEHHKWQMSEISPALEPPQNTAYLYLIDWRLAYSYLFQYVSQVINILFLFTL